MRGIRVGIRGMGWECGECGNVENGVGMRGIRTGMRGIRMGMREMGVRMWGMQGMWGMEWQCRESGWEYEDSGWNAGNHGKNAGNQGGNAGNQSGNAGNRGGNAGNRVGMTRGIKIKRNECIYKNIVLTFWYENS